MPRILGDEKGLGSAGCSGREELLLAGDKGAAADWHCFKKAELAGGEASHAVQEKLASSRASGSAPAGFLGKWRQSGGYMPESRDACNLHSEIDPPMRVQKTTMLLNFVRSGDAIQRSYLAASLCCAGAILYVAIFSLEGAISSA